MSHIPSQSLGFLICKTRVMDGANWLLFIEQLQLAMDSALHICSCLQSVVTLGWRLQLKKIKEIKTHTGVVHRPRTQSCGVAEQCCLI